LGLFDRFRKGISDEEKTVIAAYGNALIASDNRPPSAVEERKELEINIHMIEDEGLLQKLDALCAITINEPLYNRDGTLSIHPETGQPMFIQKQLIREWALALRVYASKVLATRNIDPYDAETAKIRLRRNVLEIKRNMNRKERALFSEFIDAVKEYCESALDDAKNGRKGMLLKVQQKRLEVGLSHNKAGTGK
jgi:hypothetical protein